MPAPAAGATGSISAKRHRTRREDRGARRAAAQVTGPLVGAAPEVHARRPSTSTICRWRRSYVQQRSETGARIRSGSKWLNAVSVEATPRAGRAVAGAAVVRAVEPFRLRHADDGSAARAAATVVARRAAITAPSFLQDSLCRMPELHARGLTGRGVLIGFLDTGFQSRAPRL